VTRLRGETQFFAPCFSPCTPILFPYLRLPVLKRSWEGPSYFAFPPRRHGLCESHTHYCKFLCCAILPWERMSVYPEGALSLRHSSPAPFGVSFCRVVPGVSIQLVASFSVTRDIVLSDLLGAIFYFVCFSPLFSSADDSSLELVSIFPSAAASWWL